MTGKNRNISITILITVSVLLDQLSKFLIRQNVDQYSEIKLIGDYFILTNVEKVHNAHQSTGRRPE